ncbi:MAG: nuclear transport factor 2 family protein [Erythrobacter sp.]|uniref:YybH family protein n=1 Tax=Erythrobacter sp. TaxID=1042 RepID=UPI0032EE461A
MKRLLAPLAALALLSCASAEPPLSAAPTNELSPAGLEEAGAYWQVLYEAGEWEELRTLYADDAVLMTQGQAKIEGADAILAFLQRLSNMGAEVAFRFQPEEAFVEGDRGFVTAKYRMDIAFPGKEPSVVVGRSFLVYKWRDGRWKLWRDIDNLAPDVTAEDFER